MHAHPGVLFPMHFNDSAKGVQLPRRRVAVKVLFRLTQRVRPQILVVRAHPVQYPSLAQSQGLANCRFQDGSKAP